MSLREAQAFALTRSLLSLKPPRSLRKAAILEFQAFFSLPIYAFLGVLCVFARGTSFFSPVRYTHSSRKERKEILVFTLRVPASPPPRSRLCRYGRQISASWREIHLLSLSLKGTRGGGTRQPRILLIPGLFGVKMSCDRIMAKRKVVFRPLLIYITVPR